MTAGTQSLTVEETLLEPPTLPPPPTRHALLGILIALAVLLLVATIGTGDLYSHTEGQSERAAREMFSHNQCILQTEHGVAPLQWPAWRYWLHRATLPT